MSSTEQEGIADSLPEKGMYVMHVVDTCQKKSMYVYYARVRYYYLCFHTAVYKYVCVLLDIKSLFLHSYTTDDVCVYSLLLC